MVLAKLDIQTNEIGCLFYTMYTNSRRIQDLKVMPKTVKPLEERTGEDHRCCGFGSDQMCLDMIHKAQAAKEKMDATASDLLDIKGDDQQSEKATGRMGGSIYKLCV